ncbi:1,4-alpha-glucan branching protein GlgB [Humidisolicoccus flavus]|uniref:1,4-alpha-glucan branching protein GlgB n=1 Tax=Humidisolicoccus flavus TaxID=3111414 RepID=UPI0032488928
MTAPHLDAALLERIANGSDARPHDVLGAHETENGHLVRVLRPLAESVTITYAHTATALEHLGFGIWQGETEGAIQAYTVHTSYNGAPDWVAEDPYRFTPTIGELDLFLWGEGRHEQLWQALGAHLREHEGVLGTSFTVWAPHAHAVRVIGDFNGWNGIGSAMRRLEGSSVWELFIPALSAGSAYKFELLTDTGWVTRADPMARYTEIPPASASKVGESQYSWSDDSWMSARANRDPHNSAMSIYELHFGSWRPGLSYREMADPLIAYIHELGFTHVEFMPLAEHPFGGSWGYQVTGYFAPTARYGHPDDLKYLIDRLHGAGIGVIVDWVPAHFPKDEWALANFDGHTLYEHGDPRRGEQKDWGTLVFDFGNSQVRNFLVANAVYWFEEFHVDGLRVDAVASMLYLDYSREAGQWEPNEHGGRENLEAIALLQEVNATVYKRCPGAIMIAEESTSWDGITRPTSANGIGFGAKWNMGWMNDTLRYMQVDPMYRSHHRGEITFSFIYAFSENFVLPISHDEVVHGKGSLVGKMPGDHWQKLANVRGYLAFMWAHPGKQLLFMGQEFGQLSEWSESRSLDWWILDQPLHQGLQRFVAALNRVYRDNAALWSRDNEQGGFEWIDGGNDNESVVAFLRRDHEGNSVAAVHNFSGVPVDHYALTLPSPGVWKEILNSDAAEFGGSGVGNLGSVTAEPAVHGAGAHASVTVPPLGAVYFRLESPE